MTRQSIEFERTMALAHAAGFVVLSIEIGHRNQTTIGMMDADTAVALLFHDLDHEAPALVAALNGPTFYIGALGSARTHQRRCGRPRDLGLADSDIGRIKPPLG